MAISYWFLVKQSQIGDFDANNDMNINPCSSLGEKELKFK